MSTVAEPTPGRPQSASTPLGGSDHRERGGLHVGIAGAGLLGRLLAFELLQQGHRVSLFDPASSLTLAPMAGDPARAAAWTAAGMLSPTAELECANEAVFQLGLDSLRRWPGIVATLREAGHDVALTHAGSLLLAHRGDEGAAQRVLGILNKKAPPSQNPQALTATELKALEADIHGPAHAWLLPHEGHIHTVQAMAALGAWALTHGATFHGGEAGRVLAVAPGELHTAQGSHCRVHHFDHVFDVRGVGARQGLASRNDDLGITPPARGENPALTHPVRHDNVDVTSQVRGVRGEVFWLHAPGVALQRPVRLLHPRWRVYVVPRPGNLVVVGATEIESDDRSPVSLRSTLELLSAAHSVLPGLAEARVVHSEANLRPALPDTLPASTHQPGLSCINGLFRHGWLIAPALVHQALQTLSLNLATPAPPHPVPA